MEDRCPGHVKAEFPSRIPLRNEGKPKSTNSGKCTQHGNFSREKLEIYIKKEHYTNFAYA